MGDIADMMINGDMDFHTGEYIGRGKGIPRTLDNSLPWEQTQFHHKNKSYKGVVNFCMMKGVPQKDADFIIRSYAAYKDIDAVQSAEKIAEEIQKDFASFKKWFINVNIKGKP
jgi:hypothetical protein